MTEVELSPESSFPESLVSQLWDHAEPDKIVGKIVASAFKDLDIDMKEEDSKPRVIISELLLHTYAFAKKTLEFTDVKTSVLLQVVFELVKRPALTANFDFESDKEYLKEILLPHCTGHNPIFSVLELQKILDYLELTYLAHYNMFMFLFCFKREQTTLVIQADIDVPLPKLPHNEAKKRVVVKPPEKVSETSESLEEKAETKESLRERLLNSLDESVRNKILDKVAEARENMLKQIEQRDKMLKQKLDEVEGQMKRKRRK